MKKGWRTKNLGELCEIELGKTPARANASLWDEKRITSNVWLSIADLLKAENNIVVDSKEYVSDKGAAICKLVPKGTLLVSFKLTLGRLAFAGRELFTNEAISALTIFNEREMSKEFLFYCLTFFDWVKAAENDVKLKGMTLNKAKLKEIPISFPPLPEQQRIVSILDEAFKGLSSAKANAEKNLKNARALFESHLNDVFTQRGEGWVEKPLEECFRLKSGDGLTSSAMKGSRYPVFGGNGMAGMHDEFNLSGDNVIIGRVGALCGNARHITEKIWLTDNAFRIVDRRFEFDGAFLTYLLNYKNLRSFARQAAQPVISNSSLKELLLAFPGIAEQKAIAAQLAALHEETRRLAGIYEQKLAALEALKKSLLHQAFTGAL